MSIVPLTHHEIMAVVEPFVRQGRRVDLAASDRPARRIAFRPVDHPARPPELPALRETLELDQLSWGPWRLTRRLAVLDGPPEAPTVVGPTALLEAVGEQPAELLARVEAVTPALQLQSGPGWMLALEHEVQAPGSRRAKVNGAGEGPADLELKRGRLRVAGLSATMEVPRLRGISAELSLAPDGPLHLPDDLFEVLGRGWGRLVTRDGRPTCALRVNGRGRTRYRDAELKLRRIGEHLAQTLAEPPTRFHERHRNARWRVAVRRSVPLLVCVLLVAGACAVPLMDIASDSAIRMLFFNAPPLLLAAFLSLREMPRIALPRAPRPLTGDRWTSPTSETR